MAKNNPIECVDLMVHDDHMTLWVHRGETVSHYNCSALTGHKSKDRRFHRMVKVFTEYLKNTHLAITGNLAPAKW